MALNGTSFIQHKHLRTWPLAAALMATTILGSQAPSAQAQESKPKTTAKPATKAAPQAKQATPAQKPADAKAQTGQDAAAAKEPKPVPFKADDVWNVDIFRREDHKVLVIQDRRYKKAGRVELGTHAGVTSASPFYQSFSYGLHANYFLSEYWGVDAFFNTSTNTLTADAEQINDFLAAYDFDSDKEYQAPKHFGGLGAVWSPIYGKFAFFRQSIIHFDIYGTLGASVFTNETNIPEADRGKNQTLFGPYYGLGMRVFLNNNWSLRFDGRSNVYRAYYAPRGVRPSPSEPPSGDPAYLWRANWQFTIGASYMFGR